MDKLSQKGNRRPVVYAAILLVGSMLVGCSILPKEEEVMKPPLVKPADENYKTVKATKGTIAREIRGIATFVSTKTEHVQLTVQGGRIDSVKVKSGDAVKKGDLLIQLNVDGLDLQLKEQALALEKAKLNRKQILANPDISEDQKRVADMQLEIEQMKFDKVQKTYADKQLAAPMDGQVTFVEDLKPGDTVAPFRTLVILADPKELRLSHNISNPADVRDVEVGMTAQVRLSDSVTVTGEVVQTPASAPVTSNKELADKYARTLYLQVPKLPESTRIGASADLSIVTEKRDNVVKIPRSGLRSFLGRTFVQVLEGKGLREIDVETGISSSTEIEISKGLNEGQDVVLQN
jgi:RND family efflux transporter MFP subunit